MVDRRVFLPQDGSSCALEIGGTGFLHPSLGGAATLEQFTNHYYVESVASAPVAAICVVPTSHVLCAPSH